MPPSYVKAVESHSGGSLKGLRWRYPDDRLLVDPRASACRQRPKKATRSRCMGRSRGGLTTKIHVLVGRLRPTDLAQDHRRPSP